jgi:hypothetical protein
MFSEFIIELPRDAHECVTIISDLASCKQQESEGYVFDTLCSVMKYVRLYTYVFFLKQIPIK